jgi:tetratricopeptide (TPR) repeat protein
LRVTVCLTLLFMLMVSAFAETVSTPSPLDNAKALISQGKQIEAIPILDKIVASDPTSAPDALLMIGTCYKAQKDWPQAIKYFEKAVAGTETSNIRKDIRVQIMDCHLANGAAGEAFVCLDKLEADYPDDVPRFHYVIGRRYQWMHQYAEAADELKLALQPHKTPPSDPDITDAAYRYICCSLSAMQFDNALAYLPTFVNLYPERIPDIITKDLYRWKFKVTEVVETVDKASRGTSPSTVSGQKLRVALASCYISTQDWTKALATIKEVTGDSKHELLARCYWGQNETDKAVAELKEAIKMTGSNDLKRLLMEYYRGSGDWGNMLTQTDVLLKDWPEMSHEWLLNKGWALLDADKFDQAVPVFSEAIERYPDQRWVIRGAQVSLGECLYRLGKGQEALTGLKSYYDARPELANEYIMLYAQIMYHGARNYDESLECLDKLTGTPFAYDAAQFRATVLDGAGRSGEAADAKKRLSDAIPVWSTWTKVPAMTRVAESYFAAGQYPKAIHQYKAILDYEKLPDDLRASAMYKIALCYKEQNRQTLAMGYLNRVISDYPKTQAGIDAKNLRDMLVVLGGDH